jgi:actin-like ATPase involved in cell morphogenesis
LPVNKKKLRIGNWAPEENLIYLKFLQGNKKDFVSEQERRKNKVFYRLSKILKKRTPDQCRSHHQKLQMKYEDDIEEIIQSIRRKLEKKSPEVLWEEVKKTENENKKTGVVDTY